jgi:glycerophosphoryl diester phosphodiesterase
MLRSTDLLMIPSVIAHRGANFFAPENTLAAFLKARELGFSWVEFDVMLSADNELVVIHDEELARTTNGVGAVLDFSLHDLQKLDAGSWFHPRFSSARISTLQTVLTFLYEHKLSANIEIKALQSRDEIVVQKVLAVLAENVGKFTSPPLLSSFSPVVLKRVREHSPNSLLGFLMHEWLIDWEQQCDQLRCVAVNINQEILTAERVAVIKASGRKLLAYTVNTRARAEQLYAWGVDAIFSDCPQEIVDMVHQSI